MRKRLSRTNRITVASTRVARNVNDDETQSIEARLELMRTNGVDTVKVEREKLVPFYLFSDVLVSGHLILSMESGDGMAACLWSGPTTNSTLLLTTGQTVTNGLPHTFATKGSATQVWLQVLAPGTGSISYGFAGTGNAEGISFTDTLPITAYRDKLKVQVMAENGYSAGNSIGDAVNPNINWAQFDLDAIMQSVVAYYADPERGLGIDLEYEITPFTMPDTTLDDGSVTNFYKHTGNIIYSGGHVVTNGSVWIYRDRVLETEDAERHDEVFRYGKNKPVVMGPTSKFIQHNRNDTNLYEYVKIILPSRIGIRAPNGRYIMESGGHAQSYFSSSPAYLTASPAIFQGAHVNIVNIAEENFLNKGTHYSEAVFVDIIKFCIAHELFHLIWGTDSARVGWISGAPSTPFSEVKAGEEEILEINIPERGSINR